MEDAQVNLLGIDDLKNEPVTVKVIADLYDVSLTTVQEWMKDGVIKKQLDGRVLLKDAVKGVYFHQRKVIDGQGSQCLVDERVRLTKNQADKAELELQQLRGKLIEVSVVEKSAFETARVVRDALENISPRIAAILAAETEAHRCKEILSKEINEVLCELSRCE